MSIAPGRLILLDTSVLVHLARDDAIGKDIERKYSLTQRPERPLISSITEGEIFALALLWNWRAKKKEILQRLLSELVHVDAGHRDIIRNYADLYYLCKTTGKPCGENDLWIAATAKATNAVLITCDRDFDPLHGEITRIYVPEVKVS